MIANREELFPYGEQAKHAVDCPVCGTPNPTLAVHDRYGYAVPFARCTRCSMGYLAEQMDRAGYDRLYAGGYRKLVTAFCKVGPGLRKAGGTPTVLAESVVALLPGVVPKTVLDAGGSNGVIGQAVAQQFGAHLTVLDPAAQELPGGQTIQGYLEDPIPGHYDLALCVATSDHLTIPLRAFKNLRDVARYLVIDYIDIEEHVKAGRLFKTKIDHPLYWTRPAMLRALLDTGWQPRCQQHLLSPTRKYRATIMSCA